ncbi:MAG TPA: diacylglycerol kinase family protein [Aestuariivirga sp.]|nr:diacylglycerol kinase family protein [Aestuariivirga sp.]
MRICIIINSHSGTAEKTSVSRLAELFAKYGVAVEILEPNEDTSIDELAKDAAKRDFEIIVAGGGDGTINAVASALVGNKEKKLGVLPLGTFNHFARDLGVPLEIEPAVENIVKGAVRSVDVGEVNGRIFLNNSCLGLYPSIVRLRESLQKSGYSKLRAVLRASFHVVMRFSRLYLELHPATGPTLRRNTLVLFIGNNAYETSLTQLGTRSSLEQGQLWVMMPTASGRWSLFASFLAILAGREKSTDIFTFEGEKLTVASGRRRLKVAVDGEVLHLKPPLNYRIRPQALHVIVPAANNAAQD